MVDRDLTEEESEMLKESYRMSKELHDAFLVVPIGSPEDEKPLLTELRNMVRDRKRRGWIFRIASITIPSVGTVLLFYKEIAQKISEFFNGG